MTGEATIRGTMAQMRSMIEQAALDGETEHDDLYFKVLPDEVWVLAQTPGEVVLTWCSYGEDWFDDIKFESDGPVEAIVNVEDALNRLSLTASSGTIELTFIGSEDRRLAERLRFNSFGESEIETGCLLPGSEDALSRVPEWLPDRWTEDNEYTNESGDKTLPTKIQTKVSTLQWIVEAVQQDRDAQHFPIVVEDGTFRLDVGDESRGYTEGVLQGDVEGPDVNNLYFDGFREIISVLNGPVELQTVPADKAPLAFVQAGESGKVVRHVNGSVAR